jgi:hypothetical protein
MEPISIALALAQFVPGLTRLLMGDKAGEVAGKVVDAANAVTGADNPNEALAQIKQYPELQLKLQQEMNHIVLAELEAENKQLATINATMQVEYTSGDKFVRRWRPFYGYAVAVSWAFQMFGFTLTFVYVAIKNPQGLANLVQQFALLTGSLTTLWGIALAVLGVYINKRSHDKQVAAGQTPPNGVFQSIAGIFSRNKESK